MTREQQTEEFLKAFSGILNKTDQKTVLYAFSYWVERRYAEAACIMTDWIGNDHMVGRD